MPRQTFFERQQSARRNTAILMLAFVAAVLLVCVGVNAAVYAVISGVLVAPPTLGQWLGRPAWLWISAATLAVIGFGSARRTLHLRDGGRAVAAWVGARAIDPASDSLSERRLVNVVEEMAIASGNPVPDVYVMDDEPAINAFVAGLSPDEAVLVVTGGALEKLDRDELQGIIGHEFSHILGGDMRLNVRLMGILAGLVLIGQLGRALLRSGGRGSRRGFGQAAVVGLALLAIGYLGLLFGSLIKAAISRQREYLADASAVQFTRNPRGIAGALWKIAQSPIGARLSHQHSEDISHFCFAEAVSSRFSLLMATHPPVDARIRAIDPLFELRMMQRQRRPSSEAKLTDATVPATAAGLLARCGRIEPDGVAFAETLLAALPDALKEAMHSASEAPRVVLALLLADPDGTRPERAGERIDHIAHNDLSRSLEPLVEQIRHSPRRARLMLLNLAMPTLKRLDADARAELLHSAQSIIEADSRYSVFEFAALVLLRSHLDERGNHRQRVRFRRFSEVLGEIHLLLSVMARTGSRDDRTITATFRFAMGQFDRRRQEPLPAAACTLNAVAAALEKLGQLTPMLKKSVLQACADCVVHDGKVVVSEADLLQAVAASLGCPLPPLTVPSASSEPQASC